MLSIMKIQRVFASVHLYTHLKTKGKLVPKKDKIGKQILLLILILGLLGYRFCFYFS